MSYVFETLLSAAQAAIIVPRPGIKTLKNAATKATGFGTEGTLEMISHAYLSWSSNTTTFS